MSWDLILVKEQEFKPKNKKQILLFGNFFIEIRQIREQNRTK